MAADYSDIKEQVSGLVTDLERINKEATTLQDANKTLGEIAETMAELSSQLKNVIECKQSSKMHTFTPANAHFFTASF